MLSAAMIALGQQTAGALGDRVETGPCGIANTGRVSNSPVTCNFGLTEEQLKQVTKAAVMGATEPLAHQISEISKTLGVTKDAANKLLKIVGEDPNIPEDKLAEALGKVAADYQRLQAQLAALNPDNPQARELVEQAKPEIDAGHFDRAHELLRQATQAQIAAAQQAYQLERQARAAGDTQMLPSASGPRRSRLLLQRFGKLACARFISAPSSLRSTSARRLYCLISRLPASLPLP